MKQQINPTRKTTAGKDSRRVSPPTHKGSPEGTSRVARVAQLALLAGGAYFLWSQRGKIRALLASQEAEDEDEFGSSAEGKDPHLSGSTLENQRKTVSRYDSEKQATDQSLAI